VVAGAWICPSLICEMPFVVTTWQKAVLPKRARRRLVVCMLIDWLIG
jgi:hypothetical protein